MIFNYSVLGWVIHYMQLRLYRSGKAHAKGPRFSAQQFRAAELKQSLTSPKMVWWRKSSPCLPCSREPASPCFWNWSIHFGVIWRWGWEGGSSSELAFSASMPRPLDSTHSRRITTPQQHDTSGGQRSFLSEIVNNFCQSVLTIWS